MKLVASAPDSRDHIYQAVQAGIKDRVDLREWDSPVKDQNNLGSCVGHSIANAYEINLKRLYLDNYQDLSSLFVYYNARLIDGTVGQDEGTSIRSGLKGGRDYGICQEDLWPYVIDNFDDRPTDEAYADGRTRTVTEYQRVLSLEAVIDSLNTLSPVVIALELYSAFDTVNEIYPVVPMPQESEQPTGLHAMACIGYNQPQQVLLAKNSYGSSWGANGYCWIPYEYFNRYNVENWRFEISTPATV
jgi:C1A family cysteine protease